MASTLRPLAALALLAAPVLAGGWEFAAPMPAPKSNTFALTWNGDVYMLGDSPWMNGTDKDGSVYKLANGAWSSVAPLTGMGPVAGQGGGVDDLNRIVVFGGLIYPEADLGEPRVYDPLQGPYAMPADVSIYHPPLNFGLATDAQGRIYRLGGGCDICNNNSSICSRYSGATDSWEQVAWLPYTRSSIASCFDGQGHIWGFGGYTSFGLPRLNETIRYSVANNTWQIMGSLYLPVATSDAKAVAGADGRVYCIGGLVGSGAGTPTTNVWVLDPSAVNPVVMAGPPLNVARYDFGVTLGDDGWIYVIGGVTANGPTATVERFDTGPPSAWTDLGLAKAGSAGTPVLSGSGPLTAGSANQLGLASAAPGAGATLVFGLSQVAAPFQDGTLVPAPLVLVALSTGPAGSASLPFAWPAGVPAGTELVFQFWIQDAGASHGLSASNGLLGVTD
jgi:hypothetical protein